MSIEPLTAESLAEFTRLALELWPECAYEEEYRNAEKLLLVRIGEDWCREQGCREMASDAEIGNAGSQAFHERMGFEEANRVVCYRKGLG